MTTRGRRSVRSRSSYCILWKGEEHREDHKSRRPEEEDRPWRRVRPARGALRSLLRAGPSTRCDPDPGYGLDPRPPARQEHRGGGVLLELQLTLLGTGRP